MRSAASGRTRWSWRAALARPASRSSLATMGPRPSSEPDATRARRRSPISTLVDERLRARMDGRAVGTTSTRAGSWLLELDSAHDADVVHLNGYRARRAAVASARSWWSRTPACSPGGARSRERDAPPEWAQRYRDAQSPRARRGRPRWSRRARAMLARAASATTGRCAARGGDPQRPRRRRGSAAATSSRSCWPPGGCGTRRRTSPLLDAAAPRLALAGRRRRRRAAPGRPRRGVTHARAARPMPTSPNWLLARALRSSRCRRATSRSACSVARGGARRLRAGARRHPEPARESGSGAATVRRPRTITTRCRPRSRALIANPLDARIGGGRGARRARATSRRDAHGAGLPHALRDAPPRASTTEAVDARRPVLPLAASPTGITATRISCAASSPSCVARGHEVRLFEPRDGWSRARTWSREHGEAALDGFDARLSARFAASATTRQRSISTTRSTAPISAIVHEWNEPELVARIGEHARRQPATRCCSTTRITAR